MKYDLNISNSFFPLTDGILQSLKVITAETCVSVATTTVK